MYAAVAARVLIAMNWKGEKTPTELEWQNKMSEYVETAKLTGKPRGHTGQMFIKKWDMYKKDLKDYCNNMMSVAAFE